jgi:aspartate/methionine/tyrosine aminotransferase
LPEAREAVSAYLRGAASAERILLTASTSESYALLFKLLCDPGDAVLAPEPSYPLLDLLAKLEGVELQRYPLRYDGAWHLDLTTVSRAITEKTRAIVVVSPHNPTGHCLAEAELSALAVLCARRGLALIGDEVFADYRMSPGPSVLHNGAALTFHLSGLSKVCALPQLKVGWIAASGPVTQVNDALARLEIVADSYLSVSAVGQLALPRLLESRGEIQARVRERLAANHALLSAKARGAPWTLLRSQGGWSAVLQIAETLDEEKLCLGLLEDGVVVQPGFFYGLEKNGFLVLSLLPDPATMEAGLARLDRHLRHAT